jgi:hypothetical protein
MKTKSDYQKYRIERQWNYVFAAFLFILSILTFLVVNIAKKERILADITINAYIDSLNTQKVRITEENTAKNWDKFIGALIQIESGGIEDVIGDNGASVGVLQIKKIYVDEVNRLNGTKFTYYDRYSRVKSVEMFNIMNPERDILLSLYRHNPNAGDDYYAKILKALYK